MQETANDHAGYIILDFRDVQGMDSSAIHSFLKISQIVENGHQVKLIYSQLKPRLKNLFIKGSVLKRNGPIPIKKVTCDRICHNCLV